MRLEFRGSISREMPARLHRGYSFLPSQRSRAVHSSSLYFSFRASQPSRPPAHLSPLERTALIGILNLDTGRKALLRLPNGRYRSVIVGDVLDGWRVSLIGADAMQLTRGGEDMTLLLIDR